MFDLSDEQQPTQLSHPYDTRVSKRYKVKRNLPAVKLKNISRRGLLNLLQHKRFSPEKTVFFPSTFDPQKIDQKNETKKGFYFKLKVISKVGVFIQKLKRNITLSNPDFKHNEKLYIENRNENEQVNLMLDSENSFVIFFQIIVLIFSIINIWHSTLTLVFPQLRILPKGLCYFMNMIFFLEMLMNFNTEIYDNDNFQLINKKQVIAQFYLKNSFWYDLIGFIASTILVLDFFQYSFILIFLKVCNLSKIKSCLRIKSKLENIFTTNTQSEALISIITLLFKIFTFIHFLSLLFNMTSQIEHRYGIHTTWIEKNQFISESQNLFEFYIYGWYWGCTILTTVGFGDIVPGNVYQAFLISFVQVLCCAIFGYCINYIGTLLGVLGEQKRKYQTQLRVLNKFLKNQNLNNKEKNKIRANCFYNYKMKQLCDPVTEAKFLSMIPGPIKQELLFKNNKTILKKSTFFNRFNEEMIRKFALKLQKVIYAPEEYVFNKNQKNVKLMIIQNGVICDYYNNNCSNDEKKITQYNQINPQVGFIQFVTGQPYLTYGRTKAFTYAYELPRQDFLEVISQNKQQYLRFCQLKDQMIFKGKKYSNRCLACMKLSHNTLECPKIHYLSPGPFISKLKSKTQQKKLSRRFVIRNQEKINAKVIHALLLEQHDKNQEGGTLKSLKKITKFAKHRASVMSNIQCFEPDEILNHKQRQLQLNSIQQEQQMSSEQEEIEDDLKIYFESILPNQQEYFSNSHYTEVLKRYATRKLKNK